MHCEKCFFQYEYTTISKWFLAFVGPFIPMLAIVLGLLSENWVVFGVVLLVLPFIGEFFFAKYCTLSPVGLRAMREKLSGKNL